MARLDKTFNTAVEFYEFLQHNKRLAVAILPETNQDEIMEAREVLNYVHGQINTFLNDYAPLLSSKEYRSLLHKYENETPLFRNASQVLSYIESHLLLSQHCLRNNESESRKSH